MCSSISFLKFLACEGRGCRGVSETKPNSMGSAEVEVDAGTVGAEPCVKEQGQGRCAGVGQVTQGQGRWCRGRAGDAGARHKAHKHVAAPLLLSCH